ncbi:MULTISPECIES: hypothetical protein [unclassified Aliivibrio]|jgi:hypothetical protein|uniref:hypothetical protein n=1 Tax=unclassified Aliivibrio TaxID=2645654 RepID=UPI00080E9837|nr:MULTISPECIES: hypothetical protein [unclassified Aliivibrio]OCH13695.1 hypothetical protein A6E05_05155 [Aliivibrio sp. 1S165]OCH23745.1 hypothetical protein A6E03_08880 [Aliivibrio sp. 1S128]OCH31663.1 hypothetical protein A6E06_03280 [Aliivibrio sp. 1S175]
MNKTIIGAVITSLLMSATVSANEGKTEGYHDADPRNSSARAAVFADEDGELKLLAGGGASGLTSDISQTVGFAEYYTQSHNARLRAAHFDSFGGVYVDVYHLDEAAGMYTAGYMLPLSSDEGTLFFPSLNYTYVDFKTNDIAELATGMAGSPIPKITSSQVSAALGGEEAHLGSVNLYALHPWNDTHFSVFNVNLGSSYGGVDMQVANIMWVQGIKAKVADKNINIMFELKYDMIQLNDTSRGEISSNETTASLGVDYRF